MDLIKEKLEKLEAEGKFEPIKNQHKKYITEQALTNQINFLKGLNESADPTSQNQKLSPPEDRPAERSLLA